MPPVGQRFQSPDTGEIGRIPAFGQLSQLLGMLRCTQTEAALDDSREQVRGTIHSGDELGQRWQAFDARDVIECPGSGRDHRRMTISKKSQQVFRGFSRESRLLLTDPSDRTDGQFPDSRVGIGGSLGQGTSGLAALGAFIAQAAFGHRSEKEV